MTPETVQLLVRLALTLLAVSRDWAATQGQTDSQIAAAVKAKADKAISEGESFLASLPQG